MSDSQTHEELSQTGNRIFFSLMEKVGAEGKYQFLMVVIMCVISYLTGGLVLIFPYLFYQDPYLCPNDSSSKCLQFVCTLPSQQRLLYVPQPSMSTLGNKFGDFRCESEKMEIDFVMSIGYLGYITGALFNMAVGDLMGRKRLMLVNLAITLLGLAITIFSLHLVMAGIGLLLTLSGVRNCFNTCFYFIAEGVSQKLRQKYQVAIQVFFGCGVLLNVAWYYFIGNWQIIFGIFYVLPLVLTIMACILFLRDTPMCLVLRYSFQQAYQHFKFIAKVNGKQMSFTESDIEAIKALYEENLQGELHQKKKTFTALDLFKFKSLRMMTIVLILLQWGIIFQFYAPALMLDQFDLGIFVNGLVIGVSQLLAYPICYYMITRISRKKAAYGCFFISLVCSIFLIFMWNQGAKGQAESMQNTIEILAFVFLFRFAITIEFTYFFVYFNQLYPTQIRVIGTSLIALMSGVMMIVVPFVIDLCIEGGVSIMLIFAVISGVSMLVSKFLPQTLGAAPQDEIQQLRVSTQITDSMISSQNVQSRAVKARRSSASTSSRDSLSRKMLSSSDFQAHEQ